MANDKNGDERPETPLSSLNNRDRLLLESLVERYQDYGTTIGSLTRTQKKLKEDKIEPLVKRLGHPIIVADTFKIIQQPGKETLDQSLLIRQMLEMGLAARKVVGKDSRFVELTAEEIVAMVNGAKKVGQPYTEIKRVGKRETEGNSE